MTAHQEQTASLQHRQSLWGSNDDDGGTQQTTRIDGIDQRPNEHNGAAGEINYANWSRERLFEVAKRRGIEGRTSMTKPQLVSALRQTQEQT